MKTQTSHNDVLLHHNKLGQLDTFTIHGDGFRAVVLRQGAQLVHFSTESNTDSNAYDSDRIQACNEDLDYSDNWLWVSEQAEYIKGESVRGGVPICWPLFGQFAANPQAVQDSFNDVSGVPQHGYARTQLFELDSFEVGIDNQNNQTTTLILKLDSHTIDKRFASAPDLALKVMFSFSADGFSIKTITQNNSDKTVTFSQALHTYLPTDNIEQTNIKGFDGVAYSDTLTTDSETGEWQTKTQQGDIGFDGEVDRIYHGAPDTVLLHTPKHTYRLTAENSNSTVIWNPWVDKSKAISQFAEDDYQRMLCIETANAHLDVVTLAAGEVWEMGMRLHRLIRTE